jgi:hypothetical protein
MQHYADSIMSKSLAERLLTEDTYLCWEEDDNSQELDKLDEGVVEAKDAVTPTAVFTAVEYEDELTATNPPSPVMSEGMTGKEEDAASTEATALTSVMMDRKEETFIGSTDWLVCKRVYG